MHGCKGPKITEYATGIGTHELAIDVAVNGGRMFNDLYAKNYRYSIKKFSFEVFLCNYSKQGVLATPLDESEVNTLQTITDVFPSVSVGETLPITRDIASTCGLVLMLSPSEDAVLRDIEKLRHMEATTLYSVREDPQGSPRMTFTSPFMTSPAQR